MTEPLPQTQGRSAVTTKERPHVEYESIPPPDDPPEENPIRNEYDLIEDAPVRIDVHPPRPENSMESIIQLAAETMWGGVYDGNPGQSDAWEMCHMEATRVVIAVWDEIADETYRDCADEVRFWERSVLVRPRFHRLSPWPYQRQMHVGRLRHMLRTFRIRLGFPDAYCRHTVEVHTPWGGALISLWTDRKLASMRLQQIEEEESDGV
jgi:hypothetical protein